MKQSLLKIAYLVDTISCDTAGTERQLLEILKRLDRTRFAPTVIVLHKSKWMGANLLPCPTYDLRYRGFAKPSLPFVVLRLRKLLREGRFDIVQTVFEESPFLALAGSAWSSWRPILVLSRRDVGLGREEPWYHPLFRLLRPAVNHRAAAIVVNGASVKRYVVETERVPEAKVHIVRNGVSLDDAPRARPPLLAAHPGAVWIGLVANLRAVKRIDLLVGAMALCARGGTSPIVKAVVLGEGTEREALERLARERGVQDAVFFPGAARDVRAYLQHLDIGVLCSDREGLSNAVLEYMTAGLPVVATAVGGNAELVDPDNGLLVPPGDAGRLASAIDRLRQDPELRRRMGRASRQRVEQSFTWERSIEAWQDLYRQLGATARTRLAA